MKVKDLIKALQSMPQDAEVMHLWDGEARTSIEFVWEARGGDVVTSDFSMVCYSDATRPASAPSSKENRYWETGPNPNPPPEDVWPDQLPPG
jgi:hypothetical protein